MKISRGELEAKLQHNVCDIRFLRRHPDKTRPPTRRMICTKSFELLQSVDGRVKLNYRPPIHFTTANPVAQNLVIVWDILMQDYRNVSMENCTIVQELPIDKFWKYYNEVLYPMSPEDKINLMNS